jgi:hypothetical protein
MTQDAKFMKTVGNNSKVVKAAVGYLYEYRPMLVELKLSGLSNVELQEMKLQFLEDISLNDPEVNKFMQIFFSRDDLTEIDINNVWK